MNYLNKLVNTLNKSPITIDTFNELLEKNDTFFDNIELEKELLISNGLPLYFSEDKVYLKTATTDIKDQVFCVVDLEKSFFPIVFAFPGPIGLTMIFIYSGSSLEYLFNGKIL